MSEEQNNKQEEQKIKRGKNFDVFISYRRSDGTDKAKQLDLAFSIDDCRTFFDFKSLGTGAFDKRLENAVLDAPIFIMVWTPDYFKRCVKGGETADGKTVFEPDEDDWVRKEIELALKHNKKIIPINFNHVLDKVPDYLDDEFRNKISPHNYVNLYGDNTFDATVKHIFDKEIRPFIGATPKPENKVKVRVKADADCELIDNDEVIATIQQGKTAQLFFERGEYELIARSTEFSDIENVIKRTFDDVSFSYLVNTELAYRVKQRRIQIEEEEKKKREEEERIRREEEERIRREEEERRRREEEQRLAEQRKKEEEQRLKEEQARLEEEKRNQTNSKTVYDTAEEEKDGQIWGCLIIAIIVVVILISFATCNGCGGANGTYVETATETAVEVVTPSDYDETILPVIYSIEIANKTHNLDLITNYGSTIYSSETMFLTPRIRYKSFADRSYKFYVKWINPDGSIRRGDSSPAGYTQSESYSLSYGEGTEVLDGWGNEKKGHWKAGDYAIEIWCEGTLLKRKEFTIY